MKKLVYIIISFSLMFQIVGCKKDTKKEEVVPEAAVAYD